MKRYFAFYILLVCLTLMQPCNVVAQRTFRVFKNDGRIETFFYTSLDSITAQIDADGEPLQLFHTTDSIYCIPINEIDSVSFATLPTAYKAGAVCLDDGLLPYVINADSLTLNLKSNTPDALLPKIGSHIATLQCSDQLPYGFLGKVESIIKDDDRIRVDCSRPNLTDIFESLYYEADAETFIDDNNSMGTRAGAWDVWPPKRTNVILPPLRFNSGLISEIKAPGNFTQAYSMFSGFELSTQEFITQVACIINRGQVYFSLTATGKHTLSVPISLASSWEWKKEFPLEQVRNIRIPGIAAIIEFFEELGLYVEIKGEIGINGGYTHPFNSVLHYTFDNFTTGNIPPTFRLVSGSPSFATDIEGKADITLGGYGSVGMAPLVKELSNLEAKLKIGVKASTGMSLVTDAASIETINTNMYDELDKDDFYRADLVFSGELSASAFGGHEATFDIDFSSLFSINPIWYRGVVPTFSEVKFEATESPGEMTATAILGRKLMSPALVGFGIYDQDKKLVDKWWHDVKYKDQEGITISHDFSNLKTGVNYTLHPLVHALNDNMVANPSAEGKLSPHITTGEAFKVDDSHATLVAQVKPDSQTSTYEAGFYYYEQDGEKKQVMTEGSGSQNIQIELSDLKDNTEYFYYSYWKLGGYMEQGEVKTFKTLEKRDDIGAIIGLLSDISSSEIALYLSYSVPEGCEYDAGFYYYEVGGELQCSSRIHSSSIREWFYQIGNLKAGTKYLFYAFVKVGDAIAYSETKSFRTLREDDSENPAFELKQVDDSRYGGSQGGSTISSTVKLTRCGDGNSGGFIVDKEILTSDSYTVRYETLDNSFQFEISRALYFLMWIMIITKPSLALHVMQ